MNAAPAVCPKCQSTALRIIAQHERPVVTHATGMRPATDYAYKCECGLGFVRTVYHSERSALPEPRAAVSV